MLPRRLPLRWPGPEARPTETGSPLLDDYQTSSFTDRDFNYRPKAEKSETGAFDSELLRESDAPLGIEDALCFRGVLIRK